MSRILLAWELGANYGHLAQLAAVAVHLRAAGCEVLCAVRDVVGAAEILSPRGVAFTQAPYRQPRRRAPSAPPVNHAEIFALEGYGDLAGAGGLVSAWRTLLELYGADIVVADYSPGALVAGRVLGLPIAQIGNGFSLPPLTAPMPSIRPWERIPDTRLRRAETGLVELLNETIRRNRGPEIRCLGDLFRTQARILATYPEVDPFGTRADETYVGPIFEHQSGDTVAWPEGDGPRLFAYLRSDIAGAANILAALARAPGRTLCVAPRMRAAAVRAYATDRLAIVTHPVRLLPLLRDAALVVSYGGHGLICAALAAGVPLLLAPINVEQYLHASRAKVCGLAELLGDDRGVEAVSVRIAAVLSDAGLRDRARAFAARQAQADPQRTAADAAASIIALAASRKSS